ncbi:hypothetical protein EAG_15411 [Camponotus floridanus]|uniref:Uncharacterized protein n=1 Tax=Camponotus floridanus TaxID=104421 RepID=E2AW57_CAMFO|nr:hypothetical protein EAG_15411 [Camponotus floridanus]
MATVMSGPRGHRFDCGKIKTRTIKREGIQGQPPMYTSFDSIELSVGTKHLLNALRPITWLGRRSLSEGRTVTTATAVSDAQVFLIPNMSANFSPEGDTEHFPCVARNGATAG